MKTREHPNEPKLPRDEFGTIVVGVDGSERNHAAVAWACHEADETKRKLVLVAGNDGLPVPLPMPRFSADYTIDDSEDQTRQMLDRVRGQMKPHAAGRTATVLVESGKPADIILRAAERADLVVVGKRASARPNGSWLDRHPSLSRVVLASRWRSSRTNGSRPTTRHPPSSSESMQGRATKLSWSSPSAALVTWLCRSSRSTRGRSRRSTPGHRRTSRDGPMWRRAIWTSRSRMLLTDTQTWKSSGCRNGVTLPWPSWTRATAPSSSSSVGTPDPNTLAVSRSAPPPGACCTTPRARSSSFHSTSMPPPRLTRRSAERSVPKPSRGCGGGPSSVRLSPHPVRR